jgi:hypothetical protein
MPRTTTRPKTVHIVPVPGYFVHGWKPVEQDVTPAEWEALSQYKPAPFVLSEPEPEEVPAEPEESE